MYCVPSVRCPVPNPLLPRPAGFCSMKPSLISFGETPLSDAVSAAAPAAPLAAPEPAPAPDTAPPRLVPDAPPAADPVAPAVAPPAPAASPVTGLPAASTAEP